MIGAGNGAIMFNGCWNSLMLNGASNGAHLLMGVAWSDI